MIRASHDPPNDELLGFVRHWLNLLASDKLDEACALLDEPNAYGHRWTPHDIREVVNATFCEGTRFRATYPEGPVFSGVETARPPCRFDVFPFGDGSGYAVDHDVPLNGSASDLTAQFEFKRREGAYAVILHDLHVL